MTDELRPSVGVSPADGPVTGVVLVLHGGKPESLAPSEPFHLSSRRVDPFVAAVHRQGRSQGIAVWKVRYRVRGWNGPAKSPAQDAQWALEEVRRRHGDVPVVLVGHSMGGRAAVHVLGDASVVGMVGLCPWLPDEPVEGARGRRVVIGHGTTDYWTSPVESRAWADAARPLATSVLYVGVRHTGHFMLRRAGLWTDLAVGFPLTWLGATPKVGRTARGLLASTADAVTV